jgi:hypothetical protein
MSPTPPEPVARAIYPPGDSVMVQSREGGYPPDGTQAPGGFFSGNALPGTTAETTRWQM